MKYFSVDRLESEFAILEDEEKNIFQVQLNFLPEGIKETDIVCKDNDKYYIDIHKTAEVKAKIRSLQSEIFGE